jgi:hypothetical protein
MNRGRTISAIIAAIAAGVLGLTLAATSAAQAMPAKAAPAAHPAKPKVVINCLNKPQVKPHSFVLACADGNSYLTRLSWTSWTPKLASASGTLVQNDCLPTCVGGHFHSYPTLVVFWGGAPYRHGQRYTELTVIFTGARPLIFNGHKWVPGPQTYTSPLWAPF